MRRNTWWLQDEEAGGEKGGAGGNVVEPAAARTFVADFVHDAEAVKAWDDKQVLDYHGRVTAAIDKVRPAGGKWPEKWREEMAEDFDKEKDQLGRYATPKDIWKKAKALEQRISSGEYRRVTEFPQKGTAEEQNAWRKEQGIPETPEKYEIKYPEGFVIGEADKPLVDAFLKDAHAGNLPPAAVNRAVNWFFQSRDAQMKAGKEASGKLQQDTEDALRSEWGNDYHKNDSVIDGFLSETLADEEIRKDVAAARKLNPGLSKWLLGVALQLNPQGTILPGTGGDTVQAISDEINTLKKMMGNRDSAYWKGADAVKNQQRYRELVAAKERLDKKAA